MRTYFAVSCQYRYSFCCEDTKIIPNRHHFGLGFIDYLEFILYCSRFFVPLPPEMSKEAKHRILFFCHGNICRSPMAEFVMKDLVSKAGLEDSFMIESAATSTEEIGNSVYPPARRKLAEHGIGCAGKTARQMTRSDYDRYDLLIGMDSWNIRNMRNICGGDPEGKIVMLMDFTRRPGDVADPWYTGNFEATWRDVLEGCQALLERFAK